MDWKRAGIRFVLFALLGLNLEVLYTAAGDLLRGDWNFRGHTSPWMMIDYGLFALVLMPAAAPMRKRGIPLPVRAIVYMLIIFAVEYVSGTIFTAFGLTVWDYSTYPYNLHGQIAAQFIVPWYALGLAAEWLYARIDACALAIKNGWTAETMAAAMEEHKCQANTNASSSA